MVEEKSGRVLRKMGLCVSNTYFKHRSLHKYTRVARGRDGVEIKSMIDLVQYREGYAMSVERKGIEWDGDNNIEHMWEQIKWVMVESAREVCC